MGAATVYWLYTSDDDQELRGFDYAPWFREILASVQLWPENAVDAEPSPSA